MTATAATASAAESPTVDQSGTAADDSACDVAEATGESGNAEMQALATSVYEGLDCASSESLADQLTAAAEDPAFEEKVSKAGLTLSSGEAAGGVSLSLVDTDSLSACIVTVLDSPKGKTLNCGDS